MCQQVVTDAKLRLADRIDVATQSIQNQVEHAETGAAIVSQFMLSELNSWLPQARTFAPAACDGLTAIHKRLCSASQTRVASKSMLALSWLPEVDTLTAALRGVESERELQDQIASKYEGHLKLSKLLNKLTGGQSGAMPSPLVRLLATSASSTRPPSYSMAPPPPSVWQPPAPTSAAGGPVMSPAGYGASPQPTNPGGQQSDARSTAPPTSSGRAPRGSRQGSKAASANPRSACMAYLRKAYEGLPESKRPACYACEFIGMTGTSGQQAHKMAECTHMQRAVQQFLRVP